MVMRPIPGILPTDAKFAYRFFNAFNRTCGQMSVNEFNEWFSHCGQRARFNFRRVAFRSYLRLFYPLRRKPGENFQARWNRTKYTFKKFIIKNCREQLCDSWKSTYGMYSEVLRQGFTEDDFSIWWNQLKLSEQLTMLDWLNARFEASGYQVRLSHLDRRAVINIRRAHGADSGPQQSF